MSFVNSAKQAQEQIIKQIEKDEAWKRMHSDREKPSWSTSTNFPKKPNVSDLIVDQRKRDIISQYADEAERIFNPEPAADNGNSWFDNLFSMIRGAASTAKDAIGDLFGDNSTTTPQNGNSAKPTVYSDWSPAAQKFGMDQATAYAEHMANTAHQREVADLRAAGLNPVLGVGSGASGVAGHVATSGSSAQKSLNGDFIVDAIGATAAVVTAILTKNPAYGYMAGNAVNAVGDMFTKTK